MTQVHGHEGRVDCGVGGWHGSVEKWGKVGTTVIE